MVLFSTFGRPHLLSEIWVKSKNLNRGHCGRAHFASFIIDKGLPTDQNFIQNSIAFVAVLLKFSSKSLTGFSVVPQSLSIW